MTIDNVNSDGLDSNGSAYVTGGLLIVEGTPSSPEMAVDVNGGTTTVGITANLTVSAGDTVTVTGSDGSTRTYHATADSSSLTLVGLTEGVSYTVTAGSSSATGTAAALATSMGGGMGGGQLGGGRP